MKAPKPTAPSMPFPLLYLAKNERFSLVKLLPRWLLFLLTYSDPIRLPFLLPLFFTKESIEEKQG